MNPPAPTDPLADPAPDASGLLLFAHGARDPAWSRPFEAVAEACARQLGAKRVALAFLEFMAPDLPAAGAALVDAGCRRVVVVPLFLGAGGHVRKDIPRLMAELAQAHPQVDWGLSPAVGEAPALAAAMAAIALQAVGAPAPGTAA